MWMKLFKIGGYGLAIKQVADQVAAVQQEHHRVFRRHRNKNLTIGMITGAAIGAAAALMLTPRTGQQNRQALIRQTNETIGHLRQKAARSRAPDPCSSAAEPEERAFRASRAGN